MQLNRIYLLILLCLLCSSVSAQTDTIGVKGKKLLTKNLRPGLKQYLIYTLNAKDSKKLGFWYWQRNTQLTERKGQKVITISQRWFGSDTLNYRSVYSINKASDFSPLYFSETVKNIVYAYNWYPDKVKGADSITINSKKNFLIDFKTPNYNWNLDIETFEMLPLAEGKTFAINFYDAGLDPPAYYLYKVTGSETISTYDDKKIDCWKLVTQGDSRGIHYSETYWISKNRHEFLREEDQYNNGYRYKIKMPENTPDFTTHFSR